LILILTIQNSPQIHDNAVARFFPYFAHALVLPSIGMPPVLIEKIGALPQKTPLLDVRMPPMFDIICRYCVPVLLHNISLLQ
jgi:hypothetical protein